MFYNLIEFLSKIAILMILSAPIIVLFLIFFNAIKDWLSSSGIMGFIEKFLLKRKKYISYKFDDPELREHLMEKFLKEMEERIIFTLKLQIREIVKDEVRIFLYRQDSGEVEQ